MFRRKYQNIFLCSPLFTYYFLKDKNKINKQYDYTEIEKHKTKETGIWVTNKNNVYNITSFIDLHPGGSDKIMLAAGSSVEPYWDKFTIHLNSKLVDSILYPLKIGTIKNYDKNKKYIINDNNNTNNTNNKHLIEHSNKPFNGESYSKTLIENWITPIDYWYNRNNNLIPNIDINNYKLTIDNSENITKNVFNVFNVSPIYDLTFENIKKMKKYDLIATIQCAGNRRNEYNSIHNTSGTKWNIGAISTAKWTGVMLRDILPTNIDDSIKFVNIKSIDDMEISIPIEKVLDTNGDVMLAYEMNDIEIPKEHGYPIRLIVPGYIGIRNIKYVKSIHLSKTESTSNWQQKLTYKSLPPFIKNKKDIENYNIEVEKYPPINKFPIQSTICDVKEQNNKLVIKGYAFASGKGILRVDVSLDNGKTWKIAKLKEGSEQSYNKSWAWTFWELEVEEKYYKDNNFYYSSFLPLLIPNFLLNIINNNKKMNIICKATDIEYNTQPKTIEEIWNIRGLINNSWHSYTI